jgi:hypothetical protein
MESDRPMDRLVCGDVGYGKTEVAMRAAFKAVQDKKQVAVLVPTTILAQQHYNTFKERMAEYPIDIQMLSRFKKPSEVKKTIEDAREGKTDIVIGTHRLLGKDVRFWRVAERKVKGFKDGCGCADADRHPHTPHASYVLVGHPGNLHHRYAAAKPAVGFQPCGPHGRQIGGRSHPPGNEPRGPGLLRP